jgi:LysR family hydrogen peroxide-inducible transcriptional activator
MAITLLYLKYIDFIILIRNIYYMNLRDLKYLVSVAKHLHFGKASEECFVSQPALSMQLQKLEAELGVQLLERTNKSVVVTEIGKEIVQRAKQIIQEADTLKEIAQTHQDPLGGVFKLGAFPTIAPYFLPSFVQQTSKKLPTLKLLLTEEKTEDLLKKLKQGDLDAAILALPVEDDALESQLLFEDTFLLAVPKGHKLAEKKQVTHADISGKELLLLEEGHCLRSQALEVCSLMGAGESGSFRATSLETLRQMVISGVGITLIPTIAKRDDDNIVYIPFKQPQPMRQIALVWRKSSARKEVINALLG